MKDSLILRNCVFNQSRGSNFQVFLERRPQPYIYIERYIDI